MISLKDIPVLVGLASTAIGGGVYVHDIKRDVAEVSQSYRQHVIDSQRYDTQKAIWQYQDRLKTNPSDKDAEERLRQLEYEQKLLEYQQKQLQKEKN